MSESLPLPTCGQLYLVLAMGDSGRDLEKHELLEGLDEARAILAQVRPKRRQ